MRSLYSYQLCPPARVTLSPHSKRLSHRQTRPSACRAACIPHRTQPRSLSRRPPTYANSVARAATAVVVASAAGASASAASPSSAGLSVVAAAAATVSAAAAAATIAALALAAASTAAAISSDALETTGRVPHMRGQGSSGRPEASDRAYKLYTMALVPHTFEVHLHVTQSNPALSYTPALSYWPRQMP